MTLTRWLDYISVISTPGRGPAIRLQHFSGKQIEQERRHRQRHSHVLSSRWRRSTGSRFRRPKICRQVIGNRREILIRRVQPLRYHVVDQRCPLFRRVVLTCPDRRRMARCAVFQGKVFPFALRKLRRRCRCLQGVQYRIVRKAGARKKPTCQQIRCVIAPSFNRLGRRCKNTDRCSGNQKGKVAE